MKYPKVVVMAHLPNHFPNEINNFSPGFGDQWQVLRSKERKKQWLRGHKSKKVSVPFSRNLYL